MPNKMTTDELALAYVTSQKTGLTHFDFLDELEKAKAAFKNLKGKDNKASTLNHL
ncbi:hypothetical protein ACMV8I_18795 [Ewingella sp. S1.OA.A_B6]